MAFSSAPVSAQTLKNGLQPDGFEGRVNAVLAPLLDNNIIGVEVTSIDRQRRNGLWLDALITYEPSGDAILTSPYKVETFQARTLQEAEQAAEAFRMLHPTWFFATPLYAVMPAAYVSIEPYVVFQFYSQDGTNGPTNWKVVGASGGGGGSSPWTNFTAIVAGPATATVVSLPARLMRAGKIIVSAQASGGRNIVREIVFESDGTPTTDATNVDWSEVGPLVMGATNVSYTMTLTGTGVGQNLNLVLTTTDAVTYTVDGYTLPFSAV